MEEVIESLTLNEVSVVTDPPHEEWKVISVAVPTAKSVPVKFGDDVVGEAYVDEEGIITAQIGGEIGKLLQAGTLTGLSVGTMQWDEDVSVPYDPNGPHSRACGFHLGGHPHGPQCSANCPTCNGR